MIVFLLKNFDVINNFINFYEAPEELAPQVIDPSAGTLDAPRPEVFEVISFT